MDLSGSDYSAIWKNILQFAENDHEKQLLGSLIENVEVFDGLEKPRSGATFSVAEDRNLDVDLIWPDSKTMYFSRENEEEYKVAKTGDWKCFFAGDKTVTWEMIKNCIKEK